MRVSAKVDYALRAAQQAKEQYALLMAEEQFRIALRCCEQASAAPATRLRVLAGLAEVLSFLGRYDEAAPLYEQAQAHAHSVVERAELAGQRAHLAFLRGHTDGAVSVWINGTRVADYRGPLGYPDDPPPVWFRMGLYRDRMSQPMVIYFDDYRKERLEEGVRP